MTEVRLAIGLLSIARLAMPDTYYDSDPRCELARETLRRRGLDPKTEVKVALERAEEE